MLGLEFAPAVVGFRKRKGKTEPLLKGIVVLAENEELLRAAHRERCAHAVLLKDQKREKDIHGFWIQLIKGALLKEKFDNEFKQDQINEHRARAQESHKLNSPRATSSAPVIKTSLSPNRQSNNHLLSTLSESSSSSSHGAMANNYSCNKETMCFDPDSV